MVEPGKVPVPLVKPTPVPVPLVDPKPLIDLDSLIEPRGPGENSADAVRSPKSGASQIAGVPDRFDPAKGLAAARFEAVLANQASRAYEAGKRALDGDGANAGRLIDAPT